MPADAEAVFDVVSDLDNLTTWLPGSVEVELSGPNLIKLWLPRPGGDLEIERRIDIDWDRLRIRWGSETNTSCSGSLRVLRLAAGRSAVTVTLSGPPGTAASTVSAWIEASLEALELVVATERRKGGAVHQVARC